MPFEKKHYVHMLIGFALVLLGFLVMGMDTETFGFGFLGLTLGPIMVIAGFIYEYRVFFLKK